MSAANIERAERWFVRHGNASVAIGRLVPAVRSVISAPAGIARMPVPRFLLWSALGTALWSGALAALGLLLEDKYVQVQRWLNPVSTGIVGIAVAAYLYRVLTFARR